MKKYIDLLRYIKHFDIKKYNKYDNIIKYIMNEIFDEYYHNQNESVYCLIRKYSTRYYRMRKGDDTVKMINRVNMYSKRKYIKKILKNHSYKDEDINKMINYILELKQRGYDKYLLILYFDKYSDRVNIEIEKEILSDIYI